MTTYTAESFYRATIRQSILSTTSVPFTLKVSKIPTLTSGLLTISPNTANEEIVEYNAVDGTALTITVSKRGIKPSSQTLTTATVDYNNTTYQKAHSQNDAIRGDVNHLHIAQIDGYFNLSENETTTGNNTHSGAEVFTKSIKVPVYADATARDAGIPSPSNGMLIYNTALGVLQQYIGGAWVDNATGATPNASTTVAGKVEIATLAESDGGVAIGGTGAPLVITPDKLAYFGDGNDGDVTISVNTSLTRDMYYNNLTVNTGITLDPAGYIIYVAGTLTLTGTAKIIRNGNNGGNASLNTPGAAATALATGTCGPCLGGYPGLAGTGGGNSANGSNGVAVSTSYATTSTASVAGASGGAGGGFTAGTPGTGATATQGALYNTVLSITRIIALLNSPARGVGYTQYGALPSSGQSTGGTAGGSSSPGASGGTGGNGGIIFIYANAIAGTGTIEAKGGNGGNGGNSVNGGSGAGSGGGGGSGGCGGIVTLVYHTGTPYTITLTGGTGAAGGTGHGGGSSGGTGNNGTVGQSIVIQK